MDIFENLTHLSELLNTEEQKEFLETITGQAQDLDNERSNLKSENQDLDWETDNLKDKIRELEEDREYSNQSYLGIGTIEWRTGSYDLGELFNLLCEKVTATSHIKVMSLLNAL